MVIDVYRAEFAEIAYELPKELEKQQKESEYLSGNVREKLKTARMAAEEDKDYLVNVEALEKVIPKDIPSSEISVRLGTAWMAVDSVGITGN